MSCVCSAGGGGDQREGGQQGEKVQLECDKGSEKAHGGPVSSFIRKRPNLRDRRVCIRKKTRTCETRRVMNTKVSNLDLILWAVGLIKEVIW